MSEITVYETWVMLLQLTFCSFESRVSIHSNSPWTTLSSSQPSSPSAWATARSAGMARAPPSPGWPAPAPTHTDKSLRQLTKNISDAIYIKIHYAFAHQLFKGFNCDLDHFWLHVHCSLCDKGTWTNSLIPKTEKFIWGIFASVQNSFRSELSCLTSSLF